MVSAQSGNVFDSFLLSKPAGWAFNATAKASFVSGFIPTYQETLGQRYGYSGASAAAKAILAVVYENPQLFTGLANATLVQDINVMDTLASTLEVAQDFSPYCFLLYIVDCLCCSLVMLFRYRTDFLAWHCVVSGLHAVNDMCVILRKENRKFCFKPKTTTLNEHYHALLAACIPRVPDILPAQLNCTG